MLLLIITLLLLAGTGSLYGAGKCGTPLIFQQPQVSEQFFRYSATRARSEDWGARTYETDNFTIHYALTGPHKVKMVEGDEELLDDFESKYNSALSSLTDKQKQQSAYDQMDFENQDHPQYIIKMGQYFELARKVYLGDLKMELAETERDSRFFGKSHQPGKYQVEAVDIGIAEGFEGEIYALTYPPGPGEGIVMENDFMYKDGPEYRPITSVYERGPESMTIDYSIDWDKGLKVTAVHEFYHSVQYAYTPTISDFHFWYEASAVGQEESLAPDVNDYLQYLPSIFDKHKSSSLTRNCFSCLEQYGNGIFFTFLNQRLGSSFDKGIWQNLGKDMDIQNAMDSYFAEQNTSMSELYPEFVGPLVFTQSPGPNPFKTYSKDTDIWPVISRGNLDLGEVDTLIIELSPLTYIAFNIRTPDSSFRKKIEMSKGESVTSATSLNGLVAIQSLDSSQTGYIMPLPANNDSENVLILSNNSWTETAVMIITPFAIVQENEVIPFPNPYTLTGSTAGILFTRPEDADSLTEVNVYNEFGTKVSTFILGRESEDWSWNLTNNQNSLLLPGVYFLKVKNQSVKPLLVLSQQP